MASQPAQHRRLILCIDDDDVSLRVRSLLFTGAGYDVLSAGSGEAGLEALKQNPVDLVIADHFLHGKTGTEIAKEMKHVKPGVPILLVSAAMEKPAGIEFVDGFVHKGEAPDVLLATVAHLLKA